MDKTISESIRKIYFDKKNPTYEKSELVRLANLLRDSIRKFKVDSIKIVLCEDEECATAFHIDIKLPNDKYTFVIEVSKLGKWAKVYWKKTGFVGTTYQDDVPNDAHQRLLSDVSDVLPSYGIKLLSHEELTQEAPGVPDIFNLDDNARVGDLLFYFDGRHS